MGTLSQPDRRPLRFGVFQLNPLTGELRKHGIRIRLQEQPLKLLLALLETPGEIRTREELIRSIWAEGTFVDYERGLNVGITRLRQALGDSADAPRYVETVGRKGYRFIAPVDRLLPQEMPQAAPEGVTPGPQEQPFAIPPPEPPTARHRRLSWPVLGIVGAALALPAGILVSTKWRSPETVSQRLVRLRFDLGPDMAGAGLGTGSLLAVSRDGARVAVSVVSPDGKIRLATRRLDQSELTLLQGTEQAAAPFFSPDGQWIAFFADGKLKKIPTEGGAPVNLCDADTHAAGRASMYYPNGSWGEDGNIIAALNVADGLSRVPAAGGEPELLGMKGEAEEVFRWPQLLPGGEAVLFSSAQGDYENGNIDVFSWKTGERKTVVRGGILGKYAAGYLVYIHQNELLAAPFDLKTMRLSGPPRAVLEDMGGRLAGWNYDFSENGTFVYEREPHDPRDSIFWLDRSGKLSPLQTVPGFYSSPAFSPEGKRLAFSMSGRSSQGIWVQNIWVQDLSLGTASPLTSLSAVNDSPIWTADGRNLIFRSVNQPNPGIYTIPADGAGAARRLADLTTGVFPGSISADGKWLATWAFAAAGAVWIAPLQTGAAGPRLGKPEQLFQTMKIARTSPSFSPDGRWLAYCSLDSGSIEVYVRPFPVPGGRVRISNSGGTHPVWSRNGRELFYMTRPGRKIMVTKYKVVGNTFVPGEPELWSDKPLLDLGELNTYDAAPDGNRLAVVLYADGTADQEPSVGLTVLLNFSDELRRRVPRR